MGTDVSKTLNKIGCIGEDLWLASENLRIAPTNTQKLKWN